MADNKAQSATKDYRKLNDLVEPQKDPVLLEKMLSCNQQVPVRQPPQGILKPSTKPIKPTQTSAPKIHIKDLWVEDKNKIGELFKKVQVTQQELDR